MIKIILLIALLILVSGCTEVEENIGELENDCNTNSECILVPNTNECCVPCTALDYATDDIIAQNSEEYYEWRAETCEGVACPACVGELINLDNYEARCVENQCIKEAIYTTQ